MAVARMRVTMSAADILGNCPATKAAVAATKGVDIDVPV